MRKEAPLFDPPPIMPHDSQHQRKRRPGDDGRLLNTDATGTDAVVRSPAADATAIPDHAHSAPD